MPELILLSSEFPPGPGGIGNHAFHLAHQLCDRGWDVKVITPQDYASQEEIQVFNRAQPFTIITVPSGRGWLRGGLVRFRTLAGQIRIRKADLIVASGSSAVFLASFAAFLFGLRFAAIGHGSEFGVHGSWKRFLTRTAYSRADAIICVSQFTQRLMERIGVKPRAGMVIRNGADGRRFCVLSESSKDAFSTAQGLNGRHILITVGSVTARKGQEIVIRALPEILAEFPDTVYLIAGLPKEQPRLASIAAELGIADHVRFLGRVPEDDLVAWLNCSDIFLMTSQFTPDGDCEGFGIAAVEAALCGKPAIVSDNSGLSEAVIDGRTGWVVPEGNAQAVAAKVIRLFKDPVSYLNMSEEAQNLARQEQTWARKGSEYDQLLRSMLPAKQGATD